MKRIVLALLAALTLGTTAFAALGFTTLPTGWKIRDSDGRNRRDAAHRARALARWLETLRPRSRAS
jgi:hypothetical protein